MAERIQLERSRGFKLPTGAINVARPTKWGNPFTFTDFGRAFPSLNDEQLANMVVRRFAELIRLERPLTQNVLQADRSRKIVTYTYPLIAEIRTELAGHDLACWCDLTEPCHADVLLEIANGEF